MRSSGDPPSSTYLVVLSALDECSGPEFSSGIWGSESVSDIGSVVNVVFVPGLVVGPGFHAAVEARAAGHADSAAYPSAACVICPSALD